MMSTSNLAFWALQAFVLISAKLAGTEAPRAVCLPVSESAFFIYRIQKKAELEVFRLNPGTTDFLADQALELPFEEPLLLEKVDVMGKSITQIRYRPVGGNKGTWYFFDEKDRELVSFDQVSRSLNRRKLLFPTYLREIIPLDGNLFLIAEGLLPGAIRHPCGNSFFVPLETVQDVRCFGEGKDISQAFDLTYALLDSAREEGIIYYLISGELLRFDKNSGALKEKTLVDRAQLAVFSPGITPETVFGLEGDLFLTKVRPGEKAAVFHLEDNKWVKRGQRDGNYQKVLILKNFAVFVEPGGDFVVQDLSQPF